MLFSRKRGVTPETAADFAAALGTSAQFWMNLETAWQLSKVPPRDDLIARAAKLRERFPVREMCKRGWIHQGSSASELEQNVLSFFGLQSVELPNRIGARSAAKLSQGSYRPSMGVDISCQSTCHSPSGPTFLGATLRAKIPELERLMVEPEEIRHVPRILLECGIRLVIVEPIPGSEIQGVCFWINANKSPVIGLTLKGDQLDKFWFDFWHEIEHVLNGDGKGGIIIEDFDESKIADDDEVEKNANRSAANHCVPIAAMKDFILRHNPMFSEKNMLGFARIVKRHPGIVAGQIQRLTGRWDLFKKHQPRIRQIITQTALTDGYGVNS